MLQYFMPDLGSANLICKNISTEPFGFSSPLSPGFQLNLLLNISFGPVHRDKYSRHVRIIKKVIIGHLNDSRMLTPKEVTL